MDLNFSSRSKFTLVLFIALFTRLNQPSASELVTFKDNPVSLNATIRAFKEAEGSTDDKLVASYIEVFKKYGKSSEDVINTIVIKLKENDPLYSGRGPKEVERIRGYLLASLCVIGINSHVIPVVKAELSFGYHPYLLAAAARVAGIVPAEYQSDLVPLLTRYLDDAFKDDYVDIDNYGIFWPLKQATSVRTEVINSLAKIGKSNIKVAVAGLKAVSEGASRLYSSDLILKARTAMVKISAGSTASQQFVASSIPVCSSPMVSSLSKPAWLNVNSRREIKNYSATDQNGKAFQLHQALGKPFIITFFYTRCDNPNKCSSNVQNLAMLEQVLKEQNLNDQVSVFAITYEPEFDAPNLIKGYGEGRGISFDDNFKFLKLNSKDQAALIKDLGVLVNYGKGMVNNHGSQLYVFDKGGRLSKVYENTYWTSSNIVQDVRGLLNAKNL